MGAESPMHVLQVCLAAETCGHVHFNTRRDTWYSAEPFHCGGIESGEVSYWQIFQKVGTQQSRCVQRSISQQVRCEFCTTHPQSALLRMHIVRLMSLLSSCAQCSWRHRWRSLPCCGALVQPLGRCPLTS